VCLSNTVPLEFNGPAGSPHSVPFMTNTFKNTASHVALDGGGAAVKLHYKGKGFSAVAVLPPTGKTPEAIWEEWSEPGSKARTRDRQ
jgi:hypothetical protein